MSGALGLQGRFAQSFGYGPRLGVGRYPERPALANALSQAARQYPGYGAPPVAPPVGYESPEVPAPVFNFAPVASPAAEDEGIANSLLSAILPAALTAGGTYLARRLFRGDPTDVGGTESGTSALVFPTDTLGPDPGGIFTLPDAPAGAGVLPADASSIFTSDVAGGAVAALPTGGLGADPGGIFTLPSAPAGAGVLPADASSIFTSDVAGGALAPEGSLFAASAFDAPVPDVLPDFGIGDIGGYGFDPTSLNWGVSSPGTGAFGLDTSIGPFTLNPVNIGAGALGSYIGGQMASASVRGDEQQGFASSAGGLLGGALGAFGGPIGVLIGSLLGSNLAGQFFAGEPDDPFSAGYGSVNYTDGGPSWNLGANAAGNGGNPNQSRGLTGWLDNQLQQRAAQQGYVVNPAFVNQGSLFSTGYQNRPGYNDPLFFTTGNNMDNPSFRAPDTEAGRNALLDYAWGNLWGRGVFASPQSVPTWDQVTSNLRAQGDVAPYMDWSGEGGQFMTPGMSWQQRTFMPQPGENVGGYWAGQGMWQPGQAPSAAPAGEFLEYGSAA